MEFLKEGLSHNPDSYRLYWEIGWIYYIGGEFENAITYLDKAIQYEHPAYVENTRAHVLEKLGRIDDAIKQWQEIRKKFPEMRFVAERFILNLQKEKKDVEKDP
ncbi:MAG: tetratricopeptide repeat protein, partial [Candidatus Ratteibacteria bacterium]